MHFGVKERVQQFDASHGNDGIAIGEANGWLLFSDGAMREMDPMGALREPPSDDYERAKLQVAYHEKRLKRATDAFADRKQELVNLANARGREGMPGDTTPHLEALRELQKVVRSRQRRLNDARKELVAVTPTRRRTSDAMTAANKLRNEQFRSELQGIKV